MPFRQTVGQTTYAFADLKELMAKATPPRSGDRLAGIAAETAEENVAAKLALADVPLKRILAEPLIPYEQDEVTRLILDTHDTKAFAPIAAMTVGELSRFPAVGPGNDEGACRTGAGYHAGDGRSGRQDHAQPGSDPGGQEVLASSRASATPSACPAPWPCACNPIIRPTTSPASRLRSSTA